MAAFLSLCSSHTHPRATETLCSSSLKTLSTWDRSVQTGTQRWRPICPIYQLKRNLSDCVSFDRVCRLSIGVSGDGGCLPVCSQATVWMWHFAALFSRMSLRRGKTNHCPLCFGRLVGNGSHSGPDYGSCRNKSGSKPSLKILPPRGWASLRNPGWQRKHTDRPSSDPGERR